MPRRQQAGRYAGGASSKSKSGAGGRGLLSPNGHHQHRLFRLCQYVARRPALALFVFGGLLGIVFSLGVQLASPCVQAHPRSAQCTWCHSAGRPVKLVKPNEALTKRWRRSTMYGSVGDSGTVFNGRPSNPQSIHFTGRVAAGDVYKSDIIGERPTWGGGLQLPQKRSLILVGVMTAQKYVDSRAWNVWRTWAQQIPGEVFVFVSEQTEVRPEHTLELPVIRLAGVDDSYPPQKKSFVMMRVMADYGLGRFDWFLRADDDLYVRADKLEALVPLPDPMQNIFYQNRSSAGAFAGDLNVAEVHTATTLHPLKEPAVMMRVHSFIRGQKTADARFRVVQLARDLLMSSEQLELLGHAPNEDELFKYGNLGKMPSMRKYEPRSTTDLLVWDYFSGSPNILFCSKALNCPRHNVEHHWKYAMNGAVRQMFDYFNRNARSRGRLLSFERVQYGYMRVDPLHGVDYILDLVLLFKKFKGRRATISVRRHAYAQQAFAPAELATERQWRRVERLAQLHHGGNATAQNSFLVDQVLEEQEQDEQVLAAATVHFVLPLAARLNTFRRFMDNFEDVCLLPKSGGGTAAVLTVVLFHSNSSADDTAIRSILLQYARKYGNDVIRWVQMDAGQPFSRGLALAEGARSAAARTEDPLLFFTDVDIVFDADALYRIRMNTVKGRSVYYPVVFSEFAPHTWHDENAVPDRSSLDPSAPGGTWRQHLGRWDTRRGYFRHFGYGIAGIHYSDLVSVGGLNTDIRGWGLEDVDLFDKCLKRRPRLRIVRAVDPSLVHVYHRVHCDRNSLPDAQYKMCVGSQAASYAATPWLAEHFLQLIRSQSPVGAA